MDLNDGNAPTGAMVLLQRIGELGIEHVFANAGTDFPSIVEAFARATAEGSITVKPIAVPHENLAVAMAYGHFLMSGRPQCVMLHVNVGTANAICALTNAYRERIPLLIAAGRTPFTEYGHSASRSLFIHWAQEMFDQGGMLRETVKWDYEIKMAEQVAPAIERAYSLAMSEPKGPVYLSMPREVLATRVANWALQSPPQKPSRTVVPDQATIDEAADVLMAASSPLIITASLGQHTDAVRVLGELAQQFALPVVCHVPKSLCLPTDHSMHLGYDPTPLVADADAILVLECDVPWIPIKVSPPTTAKVIHLGVDPLFATYGIRNFPADLVITGDPANSLIMLAAAMNVRAANKQAAIETRRMQVSKLRAQQRADIDARYEKIRNIRPIHPAVLTRAIDAIKGSNDVLINELGVQVDQLTLTSVGTYFQQSSAGALGWGLGAALGIKLAAPDRFVIAAVGDGSYMFGNPIPAHYISHAYDLPVLFIVTNNGGWGSVKSETRAMYPAGFNGGTNPAPLTMLEPSPDFEKVITASGGYGERVDDPDEIAPALQRAVYAVKIEKRQALLNVICQMI